ncbi:hypothetical protein [Nonomuraea jabiensis]|uniref:Peptidase inhibitor family I36 n=1 Tax=Nonomuraea jabiensis TaxID=882448 RepID=A0A7W9L9V5_9ACTN|nr:hypothetical protein [Nonomuraea jabiensis]MBB5775991.1 hypothetical protein [Nonomuraea jabiensis]
MSLMKRAASALLGGFFVLAGAAVVAPPASADPCCAPCYGSNGAHIVDRGETPYGLIWAKVLNCSYGREVTVDVSNALDPPCEYVGKGKTRTFYTKTYLSSDVRKAKFC